MSRNTILLANLSMDQLSSIFIFSIAAILIFIYLQLLSRWRTGKIKLPPGPWGLPIVGSLPFLDPELHSGFDKLARAYGPVFSLRLGTKLGVIVSSPETAREVLKDHDAACANRDVPAVARVVAYGGRDIVWNLNGPEWRMLRKVCVREMLSVASLDAVYSLRRREVRQTVSHLRAMDGKPVNIGEEMFLTIMNVITSTLWGGNMEGNERSRIGGDFRRVVGEITELLGKPNVSDFFPALEWLDVQGLQRQIQKLFERLDAIFETIIEQRIKRGTVEVGNKDFLDFMLKLKDDTKQKPPPFTMTHLRAMLMDMVVGGTDTTSNTIEWAMAHLIENPSIMSRVQQEIDRVVGPDQIVEEAHISKLHYLQAIIKETLRLHPALPLLVPHRNSETCTISGYTVPNNARIFVNVWAIHRDPLIWPDPLRFDPERFASEAPKSWDYSGNDFSYFPFGSGRRICAGISMAERMVVYGLASLIHSFDWRLPEGEEMKLEEKFGIVLKKAVPLMAIPTSRLANPKLYH